MPLKKARSTVMAEVQVTAGSLTENDSHPRNSQPLVSVIIPVYNAEKYVEQAVRSIMNQTYQNLEILITDDCSTDGSFAILQKLAEEDARIKLFRNEYNQKIVRTLNALVERAAGKYIARMDADDISASKRIEKQVAFLEANPDIAICGTNAWHIDEKGKRKGKSTLPLCYEDCKSFAKFFSPFYHPTVMAKTEVLKVNTYSSSFLYAEDYELWIRLIFSQNYKCANLKERVFEYRIFNNQTSRINIEKQIDSVKNIFTEYRLVREINEHLNIFFIAKSDDAISEYKYINSILSELSKYPFPLKTKVCEKIILYSFRNKFFYLRVFIKPIVLLALILHILRFI